MVEIYWNNKRIIPREFKFFQYPRGLNPGGVLNVDCCPTISTSSWEHNCFLVEIEYEDNDDKRQSTNKTQED